MTSRFISDKIEISSDDFDKEDSDDKNADEKNSNEENYTKIDENYTNVISTKNIFN